MAALPGRIERALNSQTLLTLASASSARQVFAASMNGFFFLTKQEGSAKAKRAGISPPLETLSAQAAS
jgi:hypothetical protein